MLSTSYFNPTICLRNFCNAIKKKKIPNNLHTCKHSLFMAYERSKSTRKNIGKFIYQLQPKTKPLVRKLGRILTKLYRQNVSSLFNQTCLNKGLLPNFTHTHHLKPLYCQFFDLPLIPILVFWGEELFHWSFNLLMVVEVSWLHKVKHWSEWVIIRGEGMSKHLLGLAFVWFPQVPEIYSGN